MNNKAIKIMIFSIILLLSVFFFNIDAKASDITCVYDETFLKVTINISDSGVLKFSAKGSGRLQPDATNKYTANDFKDGSVYKCLKEIKYDSQSGRVVKYTFKTSGKTSIKLNESESTVQEGDYRKLLRTCSYGNLSVNLYDDDFCSANLSGKDLSISDCKSKMSSSCPSYVYVVNGREVKFDKPATSGRNKYEKYDSNGLVSPSPTNPTTPSEPAADSALECVYKTSVNLITIKIDKDGNLTTSTKTTATMVPQVKNNYTAYQFKDGSTYKCLATINFDVDSTRRPPVYTLKSDGSRTMSLESETVGDSSESGLAKPTDENLNATQKCTAYFGSPTNKAEPAYWFQYILNILKYVAIVALLVFVTTDFIKALVENDKDAVKKAGINAAKRFVFCVIIFFLPSLIELIMSLFGAYGTCIG